MGPSATGAAVPAVVHPGAAGRLPPSSEPSLSSSFPLSSDKSSGDTNGDAKDIEDEDEEAEDDEDDKDEDDAGLGEVGAVVVMPDEPVVIACLENKNSTTSKWPLSQTNSSVSVAKDKVEEDAICLNTFLRWRERFW